MKRLLVILRAVILLAGCGAKSGDSKAAEQEESRAMVEMAHRYINGTMVTQDMNKAEELLHKAAEQEDTIAMFEYGKLLQESGRDGLIYINAAAEKNNNDALMFLLDMAQKNGDDKMVYKYAKELHINGNHTGTKIMADCYLHGSGIKRDKGLAKDLYREAAAAGNEDAAKTLKEL